MPEMLGIPEGRRIGDIWITEVYRELFDSLSFEETGPGRLLTVL